MMVTFFKKDMTALQNNRRRGVTITSCIRTLLSLKNRLKSLLKSTSNMSAHQRLLLTMGVTLVASGIFLMLQNRKRRGRKCKGGTTSNGEESKCGGEREKYSSKRGMTKCNKNMGFKNEMRTGTAWETKAENRSLAIFWDYENCSLKGNCHALRKSLRRLQEVFEEMEEPRVEVKSIRLYQDLGALGRERKSKGYDEYYSKVFDEDSSSNRRDAKEVLSDCGVTLIHASHRKRKEVADNHIMADMFTWAMDNPNSALALITGDGDFGLGLQRLRARGIHIILVLPNNADKTLSFHAHRVFKWKTIALGLESKVRIKEGKVDDGETEDEKHTSDIPKMDAKLSEGRNKQRKNNSRIPRKRNRDVFPLYSTGHVDSKSLKLLPTVFATINICQNHANQADKLSTGNSMSSKRIVTPNFIRDLVSVLNPSKTSEVEMCLQGGIRTGHLCYTIENGLQATNPYISGSMANSRRTRRAHKDSRGGMIEWSKYVVAVGTFSCMLFLWCGFVATASPFNFSRVIFECCFVPIIAYGGAIRTGEESAVVTLLKGILLQLLLWSVVINAYVYIKSFVAWSYRRILRH